jgi:acetyl-CoA synthetase
MSTRPAQVCGDVPALVVERTGGDIPMKDGLDYGYKALFEEASDACDYEVMNAEDPLFILYTSGSTGTPKGVLHTTGGYLLYAAMTHEYVFDYHDGDVYWCTADVGWVTGHSYIVYGPLANGATTLMFEGVPTYPDVGRFWQVCEKHKVNQFYTAPTAIRALMRHGNEPVARYDLSSLKVLGSVGEPINPEAWEWYNEVVGKGTCPIVDTWWQTETGGHMLTTLPGATRPSRAPPANRSSASSRWCSTRRRARSSPRPRPRASCASRMPGRRRCARCSATTSVS